MLPLMLCLINEYNLWGFFNDLTTRKDASLIYSAVDGLIDRFIDWLDDWLGFPAFLF